MQPARGEYADLVYQILDLATEDESRLWELAPNGGPATPDEAAATASVILDLYRRGLVSVGFSAGLGVCATVLPADAIAVVLADPIWWGPNTEAGIMVWATTDGRAEYDRLARIRFGSSAS